MPAKWALFPKGSMTNPNNDLRHDNTDPNSGGSPNGGSTVNPINTNQRGGFGQQGRDKVYQRASMGGGRGSSGNPANRGGRSIGSMRPHTRIPGHGGSPQARGKMPPTRGGGFGQHGQNGVPSYSHSQPKPGAGNVAGRSHKLIAGRFQRKAMGAQPSGGGGKYGSAPVTANT